MKIKKSIFILMVIVLITILGTVLYKGEKLLLLRLHYLVYHFILNMKIANLK